MLKASFHIQQDHPALSGHFPGHPIVPGVVVLDNIIQAFHQQHAHAHVEGFPWVKFLRPVLPSQEIEVGFVQKTQNLYQFECVNRDVILVSGQIKLAPRREK